MIAKYILFTLLMVLFGCASIPYQQISDTKQALISAKKFTSSPEDKVKLQTAEQYLKEAEAAADIKDYETTQEKTTQAQELAQEILKNYYSKSNVKFEY